MNIDRVETAPKKDSARTVRLALLSLSASVLAPAVLLGTGVSSAHAQNASLTERVADRQRQRIKELDDAAVTRQTGDPVIVDENKPAELPPAGGATVRLKSITFEPKSAFISDEELADIKARYDGKVVDFRDISAIVKAVNDLYAKKGIVTAAAILPPQDLSKGDLVVKLVEGQLGNVAFVGEHRTRNEYILKRVRLANGTTVDIPTATKDINFFNKTNSAQLRLLLKPGASFGFTDLLFGITEPKRNTLQMFFDNEGTQSTGPEQVSAFFRHYGALGIDDTFSLFGSMTGGTLSGTARYDFPISRWGTRLALGYTQSDVEVINGPSVILDIEGLSRSGTATLTQPIFVDRNWVLSATGSAFIGENMTTATGVPIVDSDTRKFGPGYQVSYSGDRLNFSSETQLVYANVNDNLFGGDDNYTIGTGSASLVYRFSNEKTAFLATGAWQYTQDELLPGNLLFQIGGPTTVRGYPSDGIAGDSGYYANLELHHNGLGKNEKLGVFGFVDFGSVYSTFPKAQHLASWGVGLNYQVADFGNIKLTAAAPIRETLSNQDDFQIYGSFTWKLF